MTNAKKSILVLGSGGALAHTFLFYLKNHRHLFQNVHLVSRSDFRDDSFVALREVDATFERLNICADNREALMKIFETRKPDIVLDLSDAPTELVAEAVFAYGKASYICCAFCTSSNLTLGDAIVEWMGKPRQLTMPHIFFTGMNPGCVNIWTEVGISKFGVPQAMVEFEYDTSRFLRWHREKMVTWCLEEFVIEMVNDPSEVMLGRYKIKNSYPNSLYNRENMEHLLSPVMKLESYPDGCIVGHEECITLANKYDMPCKFVYSVNNETMAYLKQVYEEKGKMTEEDLVLATNVQDSLVGSDNIFMRLEYADKYVYYYNAIQNTNLKEASCTDVQVVIGVFAAIFTLMMHDLKPGIHFPEDLMGTIFPKFVTDNMMIQEFVFERKDDTVSLQQSYDPHISHGSGPFIKL